MKQFVLIHSFIKKNILISIFFYSLIFSTNAQYTRLLSFNGTSNGSSPQGSLISEGGVLYGMTYNGGANDLGTVFKINTNGSGYVTLLNFDGATKGSNPYGSLFSDGTFLYGMTSAGGTKDSGVIFKIKPDGSSYAKLLDFSGSVNGSNPRGSFISDGTFLYGTTYYGGANDSGTIFKIQPDGSQYLKLLDFNGANGRNPAGSLISDGAFLYGMTYQGGANYFGTIFKIHLDGTNHSKLLDFSGVADGSYPLGSLFSDGTFLYGMTYQGGASNFGSLFKIKSDGTGYSNLLDFLGIANGSYPFGSLISDGTSLVGMTFQGGANDLGTIFKINPDGSNYVKVYECVTSNGTFPTGSLISDGSFMYGMMSGGGTGDLGTVFVFQLPSVISQITVNSYTMCAASDFSVSYNAGGVFNSGNVFTAELSDAMGDFSSAVAIGVLNSVSSGTISCTAPSTIPSGFGYRIRVVSTLPVITSDDNGMDINMTTVPTITATFPAMRCGSGAVTLGATASSGTLNWYNFPLGGALLGTGTSFLTPVTSSNTTYFVEAVDGCTSIRSSVLATINSLPVITTSGNTTICTGGSTILNASGGMDYVWSPGGETTTSITVSPIGNSTYSVEVIDSNGCSDVSTLSVAVDPCTEILENNISRSSIVFPNPVSTTINIKLFGLDIKGDMNMILFDVFGREIKKQKAVQINSPGEINTFEFSRDNLPGGVYYYKVEDSRGIIGSGKLIFD